MDIQWDPRYAIGHALIDAEHQALVALAREFAAATDQHVLQKLTMQLYKYTREHFAHEEELMREINYPYARAHTDQHNTMLTRLNDVSARIAKNEHHREAIEAWINEWVVQHIARADAMLLTYMHAAHGVQKENPENAGLNNGQKPDKDMP